MQQSTHPSNNPPHHPPPSLNRILSFPLLLSTCISSSVHSQRQTPQSFMYGGFFFFFLPRFKSLIAHTLSFPGVYFKRPPGVLKLCTLEASKKSFPPLVLPSILPGPHFVLYIYYLRQLYLSSTFFNRRRKLKSYTSKC